MSEEILINKIVDKLKKSEIKNIISIDNDWVPQKLQIDFQSNLIEFMNNQGLVLSEDMSRHLSNDGDVETIEDLINSENEDLSELKKVVEDNINKEKELDQSLQSLKMLFDEIRKYCTDINIEVSADTEVDFSKYEGNCLFFLDKNMGRENTDVIVDSILKINKYCQIRNDIILIYSSEKISEYKSNSSKLEYLNKKKNIDEQYIDLLVYKMWAVGKNGVFNELLEEVYNTLLKSMYGNSLYKVIQHKLFAQEKAFKELIRIDTSELSDSIKDSFIEGDNIIQSLDRIYDSLKNEYEYEQINDLHLKSIESLISYEREEIDKIINQGIGKYKDFRNEQAKRKIKLSSNNSAHHSIIDYSVNKYFSDISTGDIFRVKSFNEESWKYCILISQACGCVIRIPKNDINIVNRDTKVMQLLVLDCEKIKDIYTNEELQKIRNGIWPMHIEQDRCILYPTNESISINDYILDLCSLNNDGKAKLSFDKNIVLRYKPYHSEKYFSDFKEKYFGDKFSMDAEMIFEKYNEIIKSLYTEVSENIACTSECVYNSRLEEEIEKIKKDILERTISLKYGIQFSNNRFELERIGRLESKRTLILIQDYIHELSKTGAEPIPAN